MKMLLGSSLVCVLELGKKKQTQKLDKNLEKVASVFVELPSGGSMCLTHRINPKFVSIFPKVTHVLTLLCEKERAEKIGVFVKEFGIEWIHIPMKNANPPVGCDSERIGIAIVEVVNVLKKGGNVLVHCSAGLHRTGMIANAVLALYGIKGQNNRIDLIRKMRKMTAEKCGEKRLNWGKQFEEEEI